jgi:hypothetical protein
MRAHVASSAAASASGSLGVMTGASVPFGAAQFSDQTSCSTSM